MAAYHQIHKSNPKQLTSPFTNIAEMSEDIADDGADREAAGRVLALLNVIEA